MAFGGEYLTSNFDFSPFMNFGQPSGTGETSALNNYLSNSVGGETSVDQPNNMGNFGSFVAPLNMDTATSSAQANALAGLSGVVAPGTPEVPAYMTPDGNISLTYNTFTDLIGGPFGDYEGFNPNAMGRGGFGYNFMGANFPAGMGNQTQDVNVILDDDYFANLSTADQEAVTNLLGQGTATLADLTGNAALNPENLGAAAYLNALNAGTPIGGTSDDETTPTTISTGSAFTDAVVNAADTGYTGKGSDVTTGSLYNPAQGYTDGSIYDYMSDGEGLDLTGGEALGGDVTTGIGSQDTVTTAGTGATTTNAEGDTVSTEDPAVVAETNALVDALAAYQAGDMDRQTFNDMVAAADPSLVTLDVANAINQIRSENFNFLTNQFNQQYQDFGDSFNEYALAVAQGLNPFDNTDTLGIEDFYDDPTTDINENIYARLGSEADALDLYQTYQQLAERGGPNFLRSYTDAEGNVVEIDPRFDRAGLTEFDMDDILARRARLMGLLDPLNEARNAENTRLSGLFDALGQEASLQSGNLDAVNYYDVDQINQTRNQLEAAIAALDAQSDNAVFNQNYTPEQVAAIRTQLQEQLNRIIGFDDPETEVFDSPGFQQQYDTELARLNALRDNITTQSGEAYDAITSGDYDFSDIEQIRQFADDLSFARGDLATAISPLIARGLYDPNESGAMTSADAVQKMLEQYFSNFEQAKATVDSNVSSYEDLARQLINRAESGDFRSGQLLNQLQRQFNALQSSVSGFGGIGGYTGNMNNLNALLSGEGGIQGILSGLQTRRENELASILSDFLPEEASMGTDGETIQSFKELLEGTNLYDEDAIRGFGDRLLGIQDRLEGFTGNDEALETIRERLRERGKSVQDKLQELKDYRKDLEKQAADKIRKFRTKKFYNLSDLDDYESELMDYRDQVELYDAQQAFDEIDQLIALIEGRRGDMRGVYAQGDPGYTTSMPTGFGGRAYNPFMSKEEADRAYAMSQGYMPTALSQGGQYAANPYALPTVRFGS